MSRTTADVVVVDRAEADGDVGLAEVHDRVAGSRVAIGPAADGAARDEMSLTDDAVEGLVGVAEAEQVVRLVAGDAGEDARRTRGPQILVWPCSGGPWKK